VRLCQSHQWHNCLAYFLTTCWPTRNSLALGSRGNLAYLCMRLASLNGVSFASSLHCQVALPGLVTSDWSRWSCKIHKVAVTNVVSTTTSCSNTELVPEAVVRPFFFCQSRFRSATQHSAFVASLLNYCFKRTSTVPSSTKALRISRNA
jgi:hypothetical protein